jgi:hypothetical protein
LISKFVERKSKEFTIIEEKKTFTESGWAIISCSAPKRLKRMILTLRFMTSFKIKAWTFLKLSAHAKRLGPGMWVSFQVLL